MRNDIHYITVEWLHALPSEPVQLYYELGTDRYERRKVEVYRDGTTHTASITHGQGMTFLAWEPHPLQNEIEADPQFRVSELKAQDFEHFWEQATLRVLETAAV